MADLKLLSLLAEKYPNIWAASAQIINLSAILALPKGTEYFLSDLHGEHEAFVHMIKSASGVIKYKIDDYYRDRLSAQERSDLAALIYDADSEIRRRKESEEDFDKWCETSIYRLIDVCWLVSNKYSRAKVRNRLPRYLGDAMDELLHAEDQENKAHYYDLIINSVIECGIAETFIRDLAEVIYRVAVDHLHIIGDIFDRGAHPDRIMDYFLTLQDVDFQWGNHDVMWMGAACGNRPCIANLIRNNINYNNFDMLEIGYGINLRPLTSLADSAYGDDPCTEFKPHIYDENKYDPVSLSMASRMNKAISVIMLKVEGQCIMAHPEYRMDDRLLLDKIDWEKRTVTIGDRKWPIKDGSFPTIDPAHPYDLTREEEFVMSSLEASFLKSEKLQSHMKYLFDHGSLFKIANGNLLYHGCIPMNEEGEFIEVKLAGEAHSGRALLEYLDDQVRKTFFTPENAIEGGRPGDLMWYLWEGSNSPLFGKDRMTTFERMFIADKEAHKETKGAYYTLINEREPVERILREFGLDPAVSRIINGHVPVKIKDGESPRKADGLLYIIDGGMSKAYQKTTGIAGYTFIYNSHHMALVEHKPYSPIREDGTQEFHSPEIEIVEVLKKRQLVADTDHGREIAERVKDLKALLAAYRDGTIKEKR
ncbi:MAG: fructose-1,6-bisphosphatase [Lachnospiraceae bacterium]|nr:fructose-1,6-bisphosphatase [Lachnospiraceae bacterium]